MNQLIQLTKEELSQLIQDAVLLALQSFEQNQGNKIVEVKNLQNDERFDIPGLAKYLNCSVVTIHKLKKLGQLPFYRFGRKYYFLKSEIDKASKKR